MCAMGKRENNGAYLAGARTAAVGAVRDGLEVNWVLRFGGWSF